MVAWANPRLLTGARAFARVAPHRRLRRHLPHGWGGGGRGRAAGRGRWRVWRDLRDADPSAACGGISPRVGRKVLRTNLRLMKM